MTATATTLLQATPAPRAVTPAPLAPSRPIDAPAIPRKILFVSFDVRSRMGGIQRFDQRVIRCLADLQAQGRTTVTVMSLRDAAHVPADAVAALDVNGAQVSKLKAAYQFARRVTLEKPDLILFGHVLLTPLATVSLKIVPGAKHVLFAHGIEVWNDPAFARVSKVNRWAVRKHIDQLLVVSRFTADRIKSVFGLPEERLRIFPNAVDVTGATQGAPPLDRKAGPVKRLLTVARLDEWGKGVGGVLRAMPKVTSRLGTVEYTIVGDGKLRPDMEKLAADLGMAGNVRFAGRVSDADLDRAYAETDAFVMPSLKEGFGIVYLEAWRHGLPVLAGDRDAGAEVVSNGVDGVVVDPTSDDAIADGIVRLLTDAAAAARMGEAGRTKLHREYSHERFAQRLADALAALV